MKSFERWDEYLVYEHELIERGMTVLKTCLEKIDVSAEHTFQLQRALDFLLEFGDKIHNQKEETYLFPLMAEKGIPIEGGPLGVMLMEHESERELLQEMLVELPGLKDKNESAQAGYASKGFEYLKIRAEHIWKENDVLYAMGRKVIGDAENSSLLQSFEELNKETYGPEAVVHYQNMVEEMEQGQEIKTRLVDNLTRDQLHAIMETMPVEVTFVDASDTVAYFNKLDKTKIFPRTRSVVGRKVVKCHPEKSVENVVRIVEGFKHKTMDKAEFWIDFKDDKILIRYFPVYGEDGEYMGVLEVTQSIGWIQKLEGQKRLLD